MARLVTWPEIRGSYQGHWVAVSECVYGDDAQPVAGEVVDADEDLVTLCSRMQEEGNRHCAILFCGHEPRITRH
jgi:hypothetical protein